MRCRPATSPRSNPPSGRCSAPGTPPALRPSRSKHMVAPTQVGARLDEAHNVMTPPHPVDEQPPLLRLITLGLQHVLVMYAGAVAVPLIIGGALHLPRADRLSDQRRSVRLRHRHPDPERRHRLVRHPPAGNDGGDLRGRRSHGGDGRRSRDRHPRHLWCGDRCRRLHDPGGTLVSRLLPLFPPVVTGTIIAVIGISLMQVAVYWAGGGRGNPDFGAPLYLGVALLVLVSIS